MTNSKTARIKNIIFAMAMLGPLVAIVVPGSVLLGQEVKPQLKPLEHYAGTWDSEFQVINPQSSDSPKVFKGTVTGRWSVARAFMDQTGNYNLGSGDPLTVKTMMAYNKSTRRFDFYYFYSSGEIMKGETTWSADQKIMTTISKDNKGQQTIDITADFSKPGEESWLMVLKNAETKKVVLKVKGKNIRRKK